MSRRVLVLGLCVVLIQGSLGVVDEGGGGGGGGGGSGGAVSIAKDDASLVFHASDVVVQTGDASAALGPSSVRIGNITIDEADLAALKAMADTASLLRAQVTALRSRLESTCGCSVCSSSPCQNAGTCSVGDDGHLNCVCSNGFVGDFCETEQDVCVSSPCQNSGTCSRMYDTFVCLCSAGFTGALCDATLPCESLPCLNGGTCHDGTLSYTCTCPSDTTGSDCETYTGPCSAICHNGGTCREVSNELFHCICPSPYSGAQCESIVDECASNPCSNGETCYATGSSGHFCDPPCPSHPPVVGKCHLIKGFFEGISSEGSLVSLNIGDDATTYKGPGFSLVSETFILGERQCSPSWNVTEAIASNSYFDVDGVVLFPPQAAGALSRSRLKVVSETTLMLISTLPLTCQRYNESTVLTPANQNFVEIVTLDKKER